MNAKRAHENLLSTSELARRSGLNRATVRERLRKAGVEAKQTKAREKLYDEDEALRALGVDERAGLRKAQTEKVSTEAERARLKLEREKGELVPIRQVREDLQEIFKQLYQHFAVQYPRTAAARLARKNPAHITEVLKQDAEQFFNELRATHESYL